MIESIKKPETWDEELPLLFFSSDSILAKLQGRNNNQYLVKMGDDMRMAARWTMTRKPIVRIDLIVIIGNTSNLFNIWKFLSKKLFSNVRKARIGFCSKSPFLLAHYLMRASRLVVTGCRPITELGKETGFSRSLWAISIRLSKFSWLASSIVSCSGFNVLSWYKFSFP